MRCLAPIPALALSVLLTACGTPPPATAPLSAVSPGPRSVAVPAAPQPSAPPQVPPQVPPPQVDAAAFRGQGRLAFAWGRSLYVLDGGTGALTRVGEAVPDPSPAWSADGDWVAWLSGTAAAPQLWVARADGSQARQVLPGPVQAFAWSPTGDTLAAAPSRGMGGLWVASAPGGAKEIAAAGTQVFSLAWSPEGATLAYAVTLPFQQPENRSDALYTVAAAGGAPTQRFMAPGDGIALAGWWPDASGLLFWRDTEHSASLAADGVPLLSLPLSGGAPRTMATTPIGTRWLARSPDGQHMLLVSGAGREVWRNKALAICAVEAGDCRTLAQPPDAVSLDPAWSGDGLRLAFVRATSPAQYPSGDAALQAWQQTRTLWVAGEDGSEARQLTAAGRGVGSPQWSRDGQHLLFIRDGAIWLLDVAGGAPARVAGPFPVRQHFDPVAWPMDLAWFR